LRSLADVAPFPYLILGLTLNQPTSWVW